MLTEHLRLALLRQFGKSSEKLVGQPDLPFADEEVPAIPESPAEQEVAAHKRKTAGRKPLSENLPRTVHHHDLSEAEKVCSCGCQMQKIGEDITERLNVTPPRLWVDQHIRAKYACKHCQGLSDESKPAVRTAEGPVTLIPGSILSPQLLAFIWTNKFCDHLPFYRQEVGFERIGALVSRQDMSNWTQKVAENLEPLIKLLEEKIREGPVIQMDETPVKVLKLDHSGQDGQGYMWLALGDNGGRKVVRYWFAPGRASIHAREFLEAFTGYVQTDGYKAYETAQKGGNWHHVGCWAHARRKLVEAEKITKSPMARDALGRIGKFYKLENNLHEAFKKGQLSAAEFLAQRQQVVVPYLADFRQWMDEMLAKFLPEGELGKAFSYIQGQWDKLVRYVDHEGLTPDNNRAENAIRPFVVGRKNWLFHGNDRGAEASCRVFTLIETAKLNGLEPYAYLSALLSALPQVMKTGDWESLLPWSLRGGN